MAEYGFEIGMVNAAFLLSNIPISTFNTEDINPNFNKVDRGIVNDLSLRFHLMIMSHSLTQPEFNPDIEIQTHLGLAYLPSSHSLLLPPSPSRSLYHLTTSSAQFSPKASYNLGFLSEFPHLFHMRRGDLIESTIMEVVENETSSSSSLDIPVSCKRALFYYERARDSWDKQDEMADFQKTTSRFWMIMLTNLNIGWVKFKMEWLEDDCVFQLEKSENSDTDFLLQDFIPRYLIHPIDQFRIKNLATSSSCNTIGNCKYEQGNEKTLIGTWFFFSSISSPADISFILLVILALFLLLIKIIRN